MHTSALLLLTFLPSLAHAAAAPQRSNRLAVVFFNSDPNARPLIQQVRQQLHRADELIPQVTLMDDLEMRRILHGDPTLAFGSCGVNLRCLSLLGKRLRASAVVLGRWKSLPLGGQSLQYLVVSTHDAQILRKGVMEFPDTGSAADVIATEFSVFADVQAETTLVVEGCNGGVIIDGKAAGYTDNVLPLDPGVHSISVDGWSAKATVFLGEHQRVSCVQSATAPAAAAAPAPATQNAAETAASAPTEVPGAAATAAAATEAQPTLTAEVATAPQGPSAPAAQAALTTTQAPDKTLPTSQATVLPDGPTHEATWLLHTGVAATAVGFGALLGGLACEAYGQHLINSVVYANNQTLQNNANSMQLRANKFMDAGDVSLKVGAGLVLVGGSALLGYQLGWFDSTAPQISASPQTGGARVAFSWAL